MFKIAMLKAYYKDRPFLNSKEKIPYTLVRLFSEHERVMLVIFKSKLRLVRKKKKKTVQVHKSQTYTERTRSTWF